ncbi:hypothetical protein WJX74_005870 [Apatococcus lobatus]|uniref:ARID domain-containing protein n=1 Tax=Apatococcus lobatus TaxID=904363 RepID=A0AAW1Q7L1_9CHLO
MLSASFSTSVLTRQPVRSATQLSGRHVGRSRTSHGQVQRRPATHLTGRGSVKVVAAAGIRTPKGFKKVLAVQVGSGLDQHGQDPTTAAIKAVQDAIGSTTLPGILHFVPDGLDGVKVKAKIGVPGPDQVNIEAVKSSFPYGDVEVKVVPGGLRWHSGVIMPEMGDPSLEAEDADSSDDEDQLAGKVFAKDDMIIASAAAVSVTSVIVLPAGLGPWACLLGSNFRAGCLSTALYNSHLIPRLIHQSLNMEQVSTVNTRGPPARLSPHEHSGTFMDDFVLIGREAQVRAAGLPERHRASKNGRHTSQTDQHLSSHPTRTLAKPKKRKWLPGWLPSDEEIKQGVKSSYRKRTGKTLGVWRFGDDDINVAKILRAVKYQGGCDFVTANMLWMAVAVDWLPTKKWSSAMTNKLQSYYERFMKPYEDTLAADHAAADGTQLQSTDEEPASRRARKSSLPRHQLQPSTAGTSIRELDGLSQFDARRAAALLHGGGGDCAGAISPSGAGPLGESRSGEARSQVATPSSLPAAGKTIGKRPLQNTAEGPQTPFGASPVQGDAGADEEEMQVRKGPDEPTTKLPSESSNSLRHTSATGGLVSSPSQQPITCSQPSLGQGANLSKPTGLHTSLRHSIHSPDNVGKLHSSPSVPARPATNSAGQPARDIAKPSLTGRHQQDDAAKPSGLPGSNKSAARSLSASDGVSKRRRSTEGPEPVSDQPAPKRSCMEALVPRGYKDKPSHTEGSQPRVDCSTQDPSMSSRDRRAATHDLAERDNPPSYNELVQELVLGRCQPLTADSCTQDLLRPRQPGGPSVKLEAQLDAETSPEANKRVVQPTEASASTARIGAQLLPRLLKEMGEGQKRCQATA